MPKRGDPVLAKRYANEEGWVPAIYLADASRDFPPRLGSGRVSRQVLALVRYESDGVEDIALWKRIDTDSRSVAPRT